MRMRGKISHTENTESTEKRIVEFGTVTPGFSLGQRADRHPLSRASARLRGTSGSRLPRAQTRGRGPALA